MSAKEPYMPQDDGGRRNWLNNLALKLPGYQILLGLNAADVTQLVNDASDLAKAFDYQTALKDYKHGFTTWKNHLLHGDKAGNPLTVLNAPPAVPVFSATVKADILLRISKMANIIKAASKYTETIGKDLGIIGADPFPAPIGDGTLPTERTAALKPLLKIKLNKGGRPWLKWVKGKTHALKIWVDRADGKGFVLLTVATHHTYTDMFALPAAGTSAIWKYKAIYLDTHEEEEGQYSEIAQITITGV